LQVLVTLDEVPQPVWRRLVVRNDLTFSQLHDVLQAAMGWEDAHLHEFQVGKTSIGAPQPDSLFSDSGPTLDERETTLASGLGTAKEFRYWYDFGDDWWHSIAIEAALPFDGAAPAAELIDGAGACPPEDCGGPYGYADLLAILAQPEHPERAELIEYYEAIDADAFDIDAARKRLAPWRARTKRT
jgi:hypothetical protein